MTTPEDSGTDTGAPAAPSFRVLSGNPTPAELAAVTAVLSAAIDEATATGRRTEERGRSAWQLAQRPIRMPLDRGIGTWRNFSG
ncbi:MAG: acyl-CoA carboxylase subunit epsilon [Lacisediminihabitans sp.]